MKKIDEYMKLPQEELDKRLKANCEELILFPTPAIATTAI